MTLSDDELKRYKAKLVALMKVFDSFCSEHELQYFAAYGTLIGVIRHRGFIPWDDDIDVLMPRKDYEWLLVNRQKLPPPIVLQSPDDAGFYKHFAKIVDLSTSLWEVVEIPFMTGVYIDIFPLDDAPSDLQQAKMLRRRYNLCYWNWQRSLKCSTWKQLWYQNTHPYNLHLLCRDLYGKLWLTHRQDSLYKEFIELDRVIRSYGKSDYVTSYCDPYKQRSVMLREWFDGYEYMPFEDISVRVPRGYDPYLRQLYGDYMQLPHEEDRISNHSHYFIDLDKHLSIQEALAVIDSHPQ